MNPIPSNTFKSRLSNPGSGRENSGGFTFTDLLVVLAVIAILALTLLPALARTKPTGKNLECVNNLKAWGLALQIYASENNEQIPRDGFGAAGTYPGTYPQGTPDDLNAWFNLLPQNIGERRLTEYNNSPGGDTRAKFPFPGGKGRMWHCPSATMNAAAFAALSGGGAYGFFSYNFNIDLKKDASGANLPYPTMPKLSGIKKPTATVMMFDCAFNPVTEVINSSPQFNSVNPASRFRSVGTRHDAGAVIAFFDGRAQYFKQSAVTNATYGTWPVNSEPLNPNIYWDPNRP